MTPYGRALLGALRARTALREGPTCPRGAPLPEPSGLAEGDVVLATGGRVEKRFGFLWFFPDADLRAKYEDLTGKRAPESVELEVTFCNPTPGTFPVVGEFRDPGSGLHCFTKFAERDLWNKAWGGI